MRPETIGDLTTTPPDHWNVSCPEYSSLALRYHHSRKTGGPVSTISCTLTVKPLPEATPVCHQSPKECSVACTGSSHHLNTRLVNIHGPSSNRSSSDPVDTPDATPVLYPPAQWKPKVVPNVPPRLENHQLTVPPQRVNGWQCSPQLPPKSLTVRAPSPLQYPKAKAVPPA